MPAQGDEDDWETADISSFAPQPSRPTGLSDALASNFLRPSAPAFVPTRPGSGVQLAQPESGQLDDGSNIRGLYEPTKGSTLRTGARSRGNSSRTHQSSSADDEWFGDRRPVSNRQIWDSAWVKQYRGIANSRRNNAAPPVIIAPSPLHPSLQSVPPGPVMKILRRDPTDGSGKRPNSASQVDNKPKTLEEREEEYRLARERIFGPSSGESGLVDELGDMAGLKLDDRSKSTSGGGHKRQPKKAGSSGRNTPISTQAPTTKTISVEDFDKFKLVPSQVKTSRSPAPATAPTSNASGSTGYNRASLSTPPATARNPGSNSSGAGVLRQPRGPGEGGYGGFSGFGAGSTGQGFGR